MTSLRKSDNDLEGGQKNANIYSSMPFLRFARVPFYFSFFLSPVSSTSNPLCRSFQLTTKSPLPPLPPLPPPAMAIQSAAVGLWLYFINFPRVSIFLLLPFLTFSPLHSHLFSSLIPHFALPLLFLCMLLLSLCFISLFSVSS